MTVKRFEELECWKEARILVRMVYNSINRNENFKRDYRLRDQSTAAAVSTMSNIAEGFSRHSNKEFIQFLFISKSSAAEIQSIYYVALDQNYISKETFESIYNQSEKVSKLDSGLISYLTSKIKSSKKTQQTE
ncbi:four helix bundle protein [candidate division WOR-3 bacterium]|nr:four helix bundle protein [candidate division WOR-3 bacterium]